MKRFASIALAGAVLAGCSSPEAARRRGGGPGGDPGNRSADVKMHEGSRQYYQTPVRISSEAPQLAPSEQARTLSLADRQSSPSSNDRGQRP